MGDLLSSLRKRSQLGLYTLGGTIGALVGLILGFVAAQIVRILLSDTDSAAMSRSFESVLLTGSVIGVISSAMGTALYISMLWYRRQKMRLLPIVSMATIGLLAGTISGGTVQALFNGTTDVTDAHEGLSLVVIIAASIFVGALLGAALARTAPNLPPMRGVIAGLVAGVLSAISTTAAARWGVGARGFSLVGFTILGTLLGFALAIAERHFRGAAVEVEWEPNETARVGLGPQPVLIGGGKDHIFIPGAPAHISSIAVKNGQIEHVETSSGKQTALKDGDRLRINGLTMVVRATSGRRSPQSAGKGKGRN